MDLHFINIILIFLFILKAFCHLLFPRIHRVKWCRKCMKETRNYLEDGKVTLILIFITVIREICLPPPFPQSSLTVCLCYVTNIILISRIKENEKFIWDIWVRRESPYLALFRNWYVVRHFFITYISTNLCTFADNMSWVGMFIDKVESTRISYFDCLRIFFHCGFQRIIEKFFCQHIFVKQFFPSP